jgi:hypothetical protein
MHNAHDTHASEVLAKQGLRIMLPCGKHSPMSPYISVLLTKFANLLVLL